MKNTISLLFLAIFILFFYACNEEVKDQNDLTLDNDSDSTTFLYGDYSTDFTFENNPRTFQVPNNKGGEIELESGTKITIPSNCFIFENNEKVSGDVEIEFEEFLSPGSIIASKIDMKYDSAGVQYDFESAGMFRINAFKNNQKLKIADGKSIEIGLATMDTDSDFNTYYSKGNKGGDWNFMETSNPVPNKNKKKKLENINNEIKNAKKPEKPLAFKENEKYFDINLSNSFNQNFSPLYGVVWLYAGEKENENPALNKKWYSKTWDNVLIEPVDNGKNGLYEINLSNNTENIKTLARPVYKGKLLDAENKEFLAELENFNTYMEQNKNQLKQANAEADFLRYVSIKNLGLYNYDRQLKYPDMFEVLAKFDFGVDSLKYYPISIYLITGNGMAVVKYEPSTYDEFRYSPKEKNKLIAFLPNQEVCTFSMKRFKSELPDFKKNTKNKYKFVMEKTGIIAKTVEEIDKIIASN